MPSNEESEQPAQNPPSDSPSSRDPGHALAGVIVIGVVFGVGFLVTLASCLRSMSTIQ